MTPYSDLFGWWITTISWSIVFLMAVSIYLYATSRRREEGSKPTLSIGRVTKDFVFVWVLVGLLFLYIISVGIGSSILFALGNVAVEMILLIYIVNSRTRKSGQPS